MRYHYLTIQVVMRNCDSAEHAVDQFNNLIVSYPDETTLHMESWEVVDVVVPKISGFSDCGTEEDALELLEELREMCGPESSFWIEDDPCRVMAEATVDDWNELNLDMDFMRL